jgi:hypothetical protein
MQKDSTLWTTMPTVFRVFNFLLHEHTQPPVLPFRAIPLCSLSAMVFWARCVRALSLVIAAGNVLCFTASLSWWRNAIPKMLAEDASLLNGGAEWEAWYGHRLTRPHMLRWAASLSAPKPKPVTNAVRAYSQIFAKKNTIWGFKALTAIRSCALALEDHRRWLGDWRCFCSVERLGKCLQ